MTSKLKCPANISTLISSGTVCIKKIDISNLVNDILAQIPTGYRYDYMERLESADDKTIVRIHTKRIDDESIRSNIDD